MSGPTPGWFDRAAVRKVRDDIAHVSALNCNMGEWLNIENEDMLGDWPAIVIPLDPTAKSLACGTVACIAGYAALQTDRAIREGGVTAQFYDEEGADFEEIGKEVLGLNDYTASRIFKRHDWPTKYQQIAKDSTDKAGMLALLDDMLAGLILYWGTDDNDWLVDLAGHYL